MTIRLLSSSRVRRLWRPSLAMLSVVSMSAAGLAVTPMSSAYGVRFAPPSRAGLGLDVDGLLSSAVLSLATAGTSDPMPVESLTTATSTTSVQPDGSFESVIYPAPVNSRDGTGDWRPIDNTLVPADGTRWAVGNAANDYSVLLPEDASVAPVRFASDGAWVSMGLRGADGAPQVQGSEAVFDDVAAPGTVVAYEALGVGLKESIILASAPAGPVEYVFDLAVSPGLSPAVDAAGNLTVTDGDA